MKENEICKKLFFSKLTIKRRNNNQMMILKFFRNIRVKIIEMI